MLMLCHPSLGAIFCTLKHFQHFHIWREYLSLLRDLIICQEDTLRGNGETEKEFGKLEKLTKQTL